MSTQNTPQPSAQPEPELLPIPQDYSLVSAQMVIEIATRTVFFACNCPNVMHNRSLRYVQANRHLFSLPVAKP